MSKKITELDAITSLSADDMLTLVRSSDLSNKRITPTNFFGNIPVPITMSGDGRVYNHISIAAPSWRPGAAAPADAFIGIYPTLAFDTAANNEAHYDLIIPFRMEAGSGITVIVDWAYDGAPDVGTVCWVLEYKTIQPGEALAGGTTTITKTSPGPHTSGQLVRTIFTDQITGFVAHDDLGLRLYRDVSADTLATDAELVAVYFSYIKDKMGLPLVGSELRESFWQTQGIVLDATEAFEQGALQEPNVLYEADAQILAGTVYKLWYTNGWAARAISYAESLDGIVWTKHAGNPVVADHLRCTVLKDGATYIMYAHGPGGFNKLSSADGITWVVDDVGVLDGDVGEWDAGGVSNTCVWIEGSTWYMLYEGNDGTHYQIGLATSPDGVTWTKSASNPVIASALGSVSGPWVTKIGSEYWAWCHVATTGILPSDIARFRSTDLVNWTRDPLGLVLPRTGRDEAEGVGGGGQNADPTLVEVDGNVHMFYSATRNGAAALMKFKEAILPMTFADTITREEQIGGVNPNLLYNPSLDRIGVGGIDIFEDWEETANDGAIARTTTAGEFRAGTSGVAAVRLTAGVSRNTVILQDFNFGIGWLVPGVTYEVGGWARGDGVNGGRLRLYNTTYGNLLGFPVQETGIVYVQFSYSFVAPDAGNTSVRLYCPDVNGGIAYFDDLWIKKV